MPRLQQTLIVTLIVTMLIPAPAWSGDLFKVFRRAKQSTHRSSVEELAKAIDDIEKEIDDYGSVVVKQPDVWGEARWTRHREEFEKQMVGEIDKFRETINASITEADNAFLLNATALGAAVNGGTLVSPPASTLFGGTTTVVDTTTTTTAPFPQPQPLTPGSVDVRSFRDNTKKVEGVAIEPVVYLDQLSRYLKHLHQIRRINEGDDTADAPGYALNLMRIPVSVLPGDETREGHGAEVSISLSHEADASLLPDTFRDLAINDVVDELTLPVLRVAEVLADAMKAVDKESERVNEFKRHIESGNLKEAAELADKLVGKASTKIEYESSVQRAAAAAFRKRLRELTLLQLGVTLPKLHQMIADLKQPGPPDNTYVFLLDKLRTDIEDSSMVRASANNAYEFASLDLSVPQGDILAGIAVPALGATRTRRARFPVAPTQLKAVFGTAELACLGRKLIDRKVIDSKTGYFRASSFLGEETEAAYDFLAALQKDNGYDAWGSLCERIGRAVHQLRYGSDSDGLEGLRLEFYTAIANAHGHASNTDDCTIHALAWAILVESAMLNDLLAKDIQRVSNHTHEYISCTTPFYGAEPSAEARGAFNAYVAARWPIHVFAIDPVEQDQNVADAFSRRRDTQLALALAFTSGQTSAENFSRFSRQLDFQQQTISLNRTVVGFSHDNDTFGWRFYPRVQAPPIKSNMEVKFRDMLLGAPSRDRDLMNRKLEPGKREVMAVVVMPSFVPYLRMDVRTNWFEITDPNEKLFTTEDSVRIGRKIQHARVVKAQCLQEDCLTRPGDARRLVRAIDQLEKRLPLQEAMVQIPYENSQGGIQLFAGGTRNLAPELRGFYGVPAVDTGKGSTVFLVGRNFNVNVTSVIAGGVAVSGVKMLSREVMQVAIPKDVQTAGEFVEVSVATPYGVSSILEIPIKKSAAAAAKTAKFVPAEIYGCLQFENCTPKAIDLPKDVTISDLPAGKDVVLELTAKAIDSHGRDIQLSIATAKDKKTLSIKGKKSDSKGAIKLTDAELSAFLAAGDFASTQNICCIEVSGKAKVGKDSIAIDGELKIITTTAGTNGSCPASCANGPAPCSKVEVNIPPTNVIQNGPIIDSTVHGPARANQLPALNEAPKPQGSGSGNNGSPVLEAPKVNGAFRWNSLPNATIQVRTSRGRVELVTHQSSGLNEVLELQQLRQQFDDVPDFGIKKAEVAFFAQFMSGEKQLARIPAGPFEVRNGTMMVTPNGLAPLCVKNLFSAKLKSGKSLGESLAMQLKGTSADRILLTGFVRTAESAGKIKRIEGTISVRVQSNAADINQAVHAQPTNGNSRSRVRQVSSEVDAQLDSILNGLD